MTYRQIVEMLEDTRIPFAYDHFSEGESPTTPFICFLLPKSDNFAADDNVYQKIVELNIELYTDSKQPDAEAIVERVLDNWNMVYDKSEVWIPDEELYEVLYTTEVVYNGK